MTKMPDSPSEIILEKDKLIEYEMLFFITKTIKDHTFLSSLQFNFQTKGGKLNLSINPYLFDGKVEEVLPRMQPRIYYPVVLDVRPLQHKLNWEITHHSPAYLGEYYCITVNLTP